MTSLARRLALGAACALLAIPALAACDAAPRPESSGGASSPAVTPSAGPTSTPSPSPSPGAEAGSPPTVPDDCRGILNEAVLAELDGVPLNDPAAGVPTGPQPDGSLVCLWRDPRADTTGLYTKISPMAEDDARGLLDALPGDGFACTEIDGGTRCEQTSANETYPVTDGRTVFWRDGILIDTDYSNLAPEGYTSAIVASIWG